MTKRNKIKLITGVPCVLELEDTRGTETTSQYHSDIEYRFNCLQNGCASLLYLPVDGQIAIKRSGAQAGDEIELLKEIHNNRPVFSVRLISDAYLPPQTETAPRSESRSSGPMGQQPQPLTAALQNIVAPQGVRMLAPQQQRVPAPVAPPAQPVAQVHPLQDIMTRCLEVGYHANQAAYNNLRAQGIEIDGPTWEDVRATGISFFIERMKREAANGFR